MVDISYQGMTGSYGGSGVPTMSKVDIEKWNRWNEARNKSTAEEQAKVDAIIRDYRKPPNIRGELKLYLFEVGGDYSGALIGFACHSLREAQWYLVKYYQATNSDCTSGQLISYIDGSAKPTIKPIEQGFVFRVPVGE